MDQATLVNLDVNEGAMIVKALDDAEVKPNVALLMVTSDYDDWRLVLSSTSFDQQRMLKAYGKVVEVMRSSGLVRRLPPMLILPIKDPFIRDLRKLFGKTKDVNGMRLGGQTIGNRFIEDGYVYRIQ